MKRLTWKQKLIFCTSFTPFMTWLSIFNCMQWNEYQWLWSSHNAILALQYLVNGAWMFSLMILPVATIVITMAVITNGLDTNGLDR